MMSSYKGFACREPRHMKGTNVCGCYLPKGSFSDNFAAVRPQRQACRSMAGDQQNMLDAWDRSQHRHGIARQRAQAHADVANLGLGQPRGDAQRFAEDLLDTGRSGVWLKASASFPSGADRNTTVRPGDHVVTAEGTEHGPCAGVSPR